MTAPVLNVYQRINEIRKKVGYVQKDAEVKGGGGYLAVSHDAVTAIVRPYFVEFGVVVVPRLTESAVIDTGRKTSSGTPILRFEGKYDVSFVNVDDPTDVITIPMASHADDTGDKAPGKALSYATKYAILKVLMLETGESDEQRIPDASNKLEPDDVVAIYDEMKAAPSLDALRKILEGALERAHSDPTVHGKLKAWGVEFAGKFGASAPNREPVKAKAKGNGKALPPAEPAKEEAKQGGAPPAEPITLKPAPESMIRVILIKAKNKDISQADLLKQYELETLNGISVELGNAILKGLNG